jgi:hypothetical protein
MIQPDQLRRPRVMFQQKCARMQVPVFLMHTLGLAPCQFATDLLCIDWIATHAQWSAANLFLAGFFALIDSHWTLSLIYFGSRLTVTDGLSL